MKIKISILFFLFLFYLFLFTVFILRAQFNIYKEDRYEIIKRTGVKTGIGW